MIDGLQPYPEYKESEIPTFGRIPANWKVVRNGNLFTQRNQTGFGHLPILEVSLRTGVRVRNFDSSSRKQMMGDLSKYKKAEAGDLAYNMMRMWQAALGISPINGLVSPAYVVATPLENVKVRYFAQLFRTKAYLDQVDAFSRGIVKDRNRLYWADFKRMPSLLPPPNEQIEITKFFSYVTGLVERCVLAKRKMIALLNEQKQAIIQQAVTRGLDPDVSLKPSGYDWLGDIPSTWNVFPLKTIGLKFGSGVTPKGGSSTYVPVGVMFLRSQNIYPDGLRLDNVVKITTETHDRMKKSSVNAFDLLLNITGASIGRACFAPESLGPANVNQHVCIIRPRQSAVRSSFLASFLNSRLVQKLIRELQNGASREALTLDQIKGFPDSGSVIGGTSSNRKIDPRSNQTV